MDVVYSSRDVAVIDNFIPDVDGLVAVAHAAAYGPYEGQDGVTYERVSVHTEPQVVEALNEYMGREVKLLGMGFRLNYVGENPNHAIHSDMGWGEFALVLYLSEPTSFNGTAFWKHHTGPSRILPGEQHVLDAVQGHWDTPELWTQEQFIQAKKNRAAIYRSELFHSRWPFEGYGTTIQDGRLIAVAFFN